MDPNKSWQDYLSTTKEISDFSGTLTPGLQGAKNKVKQEMGYDELMKSIQPLRESIADTEGTLSNLGTNLKTRTAGKLMTNAQLSRLKSMESDPIITQLSNLNRGLGVKQQGVSDIETSATNAGNDFLTGYRNTMDVLLNRQGGNWNKYQSDWQGQQNDFNRKLQESQIAAQNQAALRQKELQQMLIDWEREKFNTTNAKEAAAANDIAIQTDTKPQIYKDIGDALSFKEDRSALTPNNIWNMVKQGGKNVQEKGLGVGDIAKLGLGPIGALSFLKKYTY